MGSCRSEAGDESGGALMASEILAVPDERIREVIAVIGAGLRVVLGDRSLYPVTDDTLWLLRNWCDEEEEYLKQMEED